MHTATYIPIVLVNFIERFSVRLVFVAFVHIKQTVAGTKKFNWKNKQNEGEHC